jgi:hypothetical protein
MRTILQQTSPCLRCTRVKDPRNCENKNCQQWQRWFINRWDSLRACPRQAKEQEVLMPVGISVGGTRYAHPNHTRTYLKNDPCNACRCPKDLCTSPCPSKRAWEESRKDVLV